MRMQQYGVAAVVCAVYRVGAECMTDLDCELSGTCTEGVCLCDPEWTGEHCTSLRLIPNKVDHYAFHQRSPDDDGTWWNSWGSSQPIKDTNGKYHLLATRMLNGCSVVPDYPYNEDLVHAVSDTLLGPYTFQNVALPTTVINPTVLQAPDGKYVVFYSGEPLPSHYHKNCTSQSRQHESRVQVEEPPGPAGYENIGCVLSIATSESMDTAFSVQAANFTPTGAEGLFCRTNPTAWIFPNGTTLLYFRSAQSDGHNEQIWVARAPHYLGPYKMYGDSPVFPVNNEDPFVFRNRRGHFIMMLHRSYWGLGMNGAKAFSYDGLVWHYTEESMSSVWSSTISYVDGSTVSFQRREEPKIYVEDGQLLAMFNAVSDTRISADVSYVMSQGIAQITGASDPEAVLV